MRRLLEAAPRYGALPSEQRRGLANGMVQVGEALADPGWLSEPIPSTAPAAEDLQTLQDQLLGRQLFAELQAEPSSEQDTGANFQAGAAHEGVQAFADMVKAVDFPEFVSGLIQGVFQAVVNASIQQMEAYQQLLAAVAMSAAQFGAQAYTQTDGVRLLVSKHPGTFQLGEENQLALRDDGTINRELAEELGVEEGADPSEPSVQAQIVGQALTDLGRERQKMMATMVLLGINRIIVTNGRINAKVLFDMAASDSARRQSSEKRDSSSSVETGTSSAVGGVGWGWAVGATNTTNTSHKTMVSSSLDRSSDAKTEVKAKLTGEVSLAFRSETFPLDRLADSGMIGVLQEKSQPDSKGAKRAGGAR